MVFWQLKMKHVRELCTRYFISLFVLMRCSLIHNVLTGNKYLTKDSISCLNNMVNKAAMVLGGLIAPFVVWAYGKCLKM